MLARTTYMNRTIVLVLAVTAGVSACAQRQAPPPPKVPVSVTRVERRDVPFTVAATGTVEPARTVEVTAQVGGLLQRVHFSEGGDVREGQILFEIDPRPYQAALEQAHGNLSRDLAQLANAAREAERARTLETGGLGTAEDAQAKQAAQDALAATVRADSAALMSARLNLEYATVRAPISGRTGSLLVKEGNLVRAAGQSLVTINQIQPILVRFPIPATYLDQLQRRGNESLRVIARQGGRDDAPAIEGVLSFFDNHVDTTTATVLLKARYPNAEGQLWPGEFVNVTLVLGIQQGATVVPAQAVLTGQQGSYVFTVEGGTTAKQQAVTVARTADSVAVISAGLEPGATVVIDGQLRLSQNAKVEIKSSTLAADSGRSSLGARGAPPADSQPARGRGRAKRS
jgi:multidrug efflux system membrane fusion protein